ncbi:hypothetical protein LQW54_005362 [Pestalotiopsis sp. IQ-011]
MKSASLLVSLSAVATVFALPEYLKRDGNDTWVPQEWIAPGPDDARGPCPGLNTLANHGYLPRNGKNITLDILRDAMLNGFNIAHTDAEGLFPLALRTAPDYPNTDNFDLFNLGRHDILEHDISLSRSDAWFADQDPFNETVWAETASYFTTDFITVQQLADARMGRLATSQATNPNFTLSSLADGFSWGECATFFEILADGTTGTVNKTFIEYWFRNERMPTEIGWSRRPTVMQSSEREYYTMLLMQAGGVLKLH